MFNIETLENKHTPARHTLPMHSHPENEKIPVLSQATPKKALIDDSMLAAGGRETGFAFVWLCKEGTPLNCSSHASHG